MSNSKPDIQTFLEEVTGITVYFQPPPNVVISYPCVIYEMVRINTDFADNKPYQLTQVYQLTHIDEDPDSDVPMKLANLPMCVFERKYETNELYHKVFRRVY